MSPPDQADASLQSDFIGWGESGGILGGLRKIPHLVAIYWVRILPRSIPFSLTMV